MIFNLLLKTVWFLLPAGASNMAPVFAAKLFPGLSLPVDGGRSFRGKRLFGEHKTVRGFIAGTLLATAVYLLQVYCYKRFPAIRDLSVFPYDEVSLLLGPCMGLGALLGDLIKSFFKRQFNRPPGKSWFPFDQIDWVLGTFLLVLPFINPPSGLFVTALIMGPVLSMLARVIGYVLGLNKVPL